MTDGIRWAASIAGAALLTLYQIPQVVRIVRRRSSEDFSLPAYTMVWAGLACYVVATTGTPANLSAWVSLVNVSVLVLVILNFRAPRSGAPCHRCGKPATVRVVLDDGTVLCAAWCNPKRD